MVARFTEGEVDFTVPSNGQRTKTWYRVSGPLTPSTVPLVLLHGGPGFCSDYLFPLERFTETHGITTINYDQIGNGRSTHLRDRRGDEDFWTEDLFIAELENLLAKLGVTGQYDILGQSWGGMLGARYATKQPPRLRKLVIANSPADMELWVRSTGRLRAALPQDVQDVLKRHEDDGTTDSKEYEAAVTEFYKLHLCRIFPFPKALQDSLNWIAEDSTTYNTMNGPSEFTVVGSLRNWSLLNVLHKIQASSLVLYGEYDEAQVETVMPFVEKIPDVKLHKFEGASHCSHLEVPGEYIQLVGDFLSG